MTEQSNYSNTTSIRRGWYMNKNTLLLLSLLAYDCCLSLSTIAVVDAVIVNDNQPVHHENVPMMIDDDPSIHPIGLIEEWIDVIKEENRQEREQTMRMLGSKVTNEEDVLTNVLRQVEWDLMMEEVDKEFDQREENLEDDEEEEDDDEIDEEDNELEEEEEFGEQEVIQSATNGTSPVAVLNRHDRDRRMQSSGSCVKSAGSLQTAVRGTNPSSASRITVCTQRMKLGSTARRRTRQLQQTGGFNKGLTGGGINFSDRWIVLTCQYVRKRCILDGEGLSRIFYGTNAVLYLIGFQFLNATSNDKVGSGSAMTFLDGSKIIVRDCSFLYNKAKNGGGAVVMHQSRLQLRNGQKSITKFVNNEAQYGGAIYSVNSSIETIKSTNPVAWNENQAGGSGGAIFMLNGTLSLNQTSMGMNKATDGGAGFFIGVDVRINGMAVAKNKANKTGGGLIFHSSTVKATKINITSNQAKSDVGAILFVDSRVLMQNFLVAGNFGNTTGGISIISTKISITNGIFVSNKANNAGGAITIVLSNVTFTGSTFVNNTGGSREENNYSLNSSNLVFVTQRPTTTSPTGPPVPTTSPPTSDCSDC